MTDIDPKIAEFVDICRTVEFGLMTAAETVAFARPGEPVEPLEILARAAYCSARTELFDSADSSVLDLINPALIPPIPEGAGLGLVAAAANSARNLLRATALRLVDDIMVDADTPSPLDNPTGSYL